MTLSEALSRPLKVTAFAATLAMGAIASQPAGARTSDHGKTCRRITKTQVETLFDRWNRALLTKSPDAVVATYARDATLLPTVQTGPLIGPAAIRAYFVDFLKKSPSGRIDQRVIHTGCNIAYDIGLYTFTIKGDQPGSRQDVHARYTFIYAPEHGTWLIVHHHSSAVPMPQG